MACRGYICFEGRGSMTWQLYSSHVSADGWWTFSILESDKSDVCLWVEGRPEQYHIMMIMIESWRYHWHCHNKTRTVITGGKFEGLCMRYMKPAKLLSSAKRGLSAPNENGVYVVYGLRLTQLILLKQCASSCTSDPAPYHSTAAYKYWIDSF